MSLPCINPLLTEKGLVVSVTLKKLGNAVNILAESSSESSTIKLLSVMAVAIKSLWAA